MANAPAFDWVCEALEKRTTLDRLEARGTVRLALKQAGLEARDVTSEQMAVILEKVLPPELELRGVESELDVCQEIAQSLQGADLEEQASDTPDAVFRRLGGA